MEQVYHKGLVVQCVGPRLRAPRLVVAPQCPQRESFLAPKTRMRIVGVEGERFVKGR